jgi:hypothetical protein
MKYVSGISLFVLFMVLSFPVTSDAFSRRSHGSEMGPQTTPLNTSQTHGHDNVSAQAVPEPPVLLLMSIGLGLFSVGAIVKRVRRSV